MFDAKRLLDQFLGAQGTGSTPLSGLGGGLGGVGGGALAGGLAGVLLGTKQGRKLGGTALKVGGMAAVGALAYVAYRNWQAGQQPSTAPAPMLPPPQETPFNPTDHDEQQCLGRNLLRAMIAAAKADGHIDAKEQAAIFVRMDQLPLHRDDKAFVVDELRAPLDIDAVARTARSPEEAAEIYAASLLAIDRNRPAERGYLSMLAARLNLDDALVAHLHAAVDSAAVEVPAAR